MGEPESRWLDEFADELLAWVELRRAQGVDVGELAGEVCARVSGAVDALTATGQIDAEQERTLRRRVAAVADDATVSEPQTFEVADDGVLVPETPPGSAGVVASSALLRVVAVGRCVGLLADEPLTLLTVEMWSDRVELVWFVATGTDPVFPVWRLVDDAGTDYVVASTAEDADARGVRGRVVFIPGVPPPATCLTGEVEVAGRTTARAKVALRVLT